MSLNKWITLLFYCFIVLLFYCFDKLRCELLVTEDYEVINGLRKNK